jgi:putative phosphoribosyl transferase
MKAFKNRQQAGMLLAEKLKDDVNHKNTVVLALPRGGVPVAYEVAQAYALPLDVLMVRKLGLPGHEEFAMGALAENGVMSLNTSVVQGCHVSQKVLDEVIEREEAALLRRSRLYRKDRPRISLQHKHIILVDDGMATGESMQVAADALHRYQLMSLVVAVPVASRDAVDRLRACVDDVICLSQPEPFQAVGSWYEDFTQVTDDDVIVMLSW